jgi:hypothetical protein
MAAAIPFFGAAAGVVVLGITSGLAGGGRLGSGVMGITR